MTDMKPRQSFEGRIRAVLDARSQSLDPAVRLRLDRVRRQALAGQRRAGPRWTWTVLAGASAAATAALMVLVLQTPQPSPSSVPSAPQTADLDLLTRGDFDVLVEDPEFYAWIAAQSELAEDAPAEEGQSG